MECVVGALPFLVCVHSSSLPPLFFVNLLLPSFLSVKACDGGSLGFPGALAARGPP